MTKFRVKLCTLLATIFVACVMCGVCMFTFADGANAATVDENGWNTQVTRGDAKADVGHSIGDEGFSTYTDLQSGDQITYGSMFKSGKDGLVRTTPYRISMSAKGTGSISWALQIEKDGARSTVFGGTMNIGGVALNSPVGLDLGGRESPVIAAGQPFHLVFDGHHEYGGNFYYVDANGAEQQLGQTTGAAFNSANAPEEFYLVVTVNGEGVEQVSVKAGEGLVLFADAANFKEGFSLNSFSPKGAHECVNGGQRIVFKGYDFTTTVTHDTSDLKPYVTVGGVRVDTDGKDETAIYGKDVFGYYTYTIPHDATDATLALASAEHTVTYMYGSEKLVETYIKSGDKAYDKSIAIAGKRITGWCSDAELKNEFDFTTALTTDQTLYAKTVDTNVVNFKKADGTILSFQNVDKGAVVSEPAAPMEQGMTFLGWYTAADAKTKYDFAQPVNASMDLYAIFAYNVTAKVLGFNGGEQFFDVPVLKDGKITEDMMPSFAQITGFPAYTNIELVWYTDATMAEKANFGTNGITVEGPMAFVAAIKDKDIGVANEYVRPNADGWDRNRSGTKDAEGNTVTANQTLAPNSKYGSAEALKSVDGYSDINIDFVGYIANTRKFDVTKDVYLSYTLNSKDESANDPDGPKHEQKHFFVGMFNSLTGALISQGQMHEPNFGSIAVFSHRVNTEVQNNENFGAGKLNLVTAGTSENNSFTYEENKQVDLKITIGTENTKIYQLKGSEWVEVATMNATQKMFPDGMYLVLETTRITWINARAAQISTVTAGAVANGTFTIDTKEAATGLMSGERVYFTATPAEGYQFSEDGVFAGGAKVTVGYDEAKKSYYFNMPFGTNEVTVKFSVPVIFMADGKEVNEKLYVLAGEVIDEFDVDAAPEKTGHSFVGWFADEALTKAFDFENTAVTKSIALYAKYEKNQYTITFMDGENKYKTATALYEDKIVAPEAPTKDGYKFVGWYTDKECTKEYDFNTTVSSAVTVYAKWEESKTGCGSIAAVSASASAAVVLLAIAAVVLTKKKKAR